MSRTNRILEQIDRLEKIRDAANEILNDDVFADLTESEERSLGPLASNVIELIKEIRRNIGAVSKRANNSGIRKKDRLPVEQSERDS